MHHTTIISNQRPRTELASRVLSDISLIVMLRNGVAGLSRYNCLAPRLFCWWDERRLASLAIDVALRNVT